MHIIKLLMHTVFYLFLFEFWERRIKRNEKEIQADMKMCTGADVSLA